MRLPFPRIAIGLMLLPVAALDVAATESVRWFGFIEMMVFLVILVIGYVYAWAKGALDWE